MASHLDWIIVYDDGVTAGPQDEDTGYIPEAPPVTLYDGPCNAQDTGLQVVRGIGAAGAEAVVTSNTRCYLPPSNDAVLATAKMRTGLAAKIRWRQTQTWSEGQIVEARREDRRLKLMLVGASA